MQRFFQGRTNNHLTWVMVDSTDFATPESALSAATKIKIYGKLKGATGTNFVSSGTGSLTNDITHVGASALGIYTIALASADLSDASAAFYDQYIVSLSATGAAYQTLVIEGVKSGENVSNISAQLSDAQSYLVAVSGTLSDVQSAVALTQSFASDAASAAQQVNSRVLLMISTLSDIDSALTSQFNAVSDAVSNVYSATLLTQSMASDAASAAREGSSRALLMISTLSDIDSALTSQFTYESGQISDIRSMLTYLSGAVSDVYSGLGDVSVTLTASDISDIASATAAAIGFTPSAIAEKVWSDYTSKVGATPSQVYSSLLAQLGNNRAEPGQGTPPATTTALAKLDYLYKAWRNRTTQTASQYSLYADDAATVDHKATFSDNGTTADRGEVATGP